MKVFNHGIHIVLDILTCGLWLPIHLLLWALAPTVPVGAGAASSSAAAGSANTTIVFGGTGPHPQVIHDGQTPGAPISYHPQQHTQAAQQSVPPPPTPPSWAIEEARERLPQDAPWDAVASVAWEFVQRKQIGNDQPPAPEPRQLPE